MILKPDDKRHQRGFTLVELLIVVTIIGILAAIIGLQTPLYRTKASNTSARADIKRAYLASQAYFTDYPSGELTGLILHSYGFRPTPQVTLTVNGGSVNELNMTASHSSGDTEYTVDHTGTILP